MTARKPAPQRDVALVPIKTWLKGSTFLALERVAEQRHTSVGVLLAHLADRAVTPKPTKPRRSYVWVTPAMRAEILRLHELGMTKAEIASQVGCSPASVYNHLPKGAQR